MEKKIINGYDKKFYLLGRNKEGKTYWLASPSWDCDWYWGFGNLYVVSGNHNPKVNKNIEEMDHFKYLLLSDTTRLAKEVFDDFFVETSLNDNEIYQLLDYMMSCYNLRTTAEILNRGYSHQTETAKIDVLKNEDLANYINKTLLPAIFERINKLLGGEQ